MQIDKFKIVANIAMNIHPIGCMKYVEQQINYVENQNKINNSPKKVLIIGSSSGFGLASRIALAFAGGADTIGISMESGISSKRLGSAGWWNNIAFKEQAEKKNLIAKNILGDCFSDEIKQQTINYIKEKFGGKVDLVIYSVASGRRTDPKDKMTYSSVLKSTTGDIEAYTVDLSKKKLKKEKMLNATDKEINNTIKVMGGEDWQLWLKALLDANVLAKNSKTIAYSYIGPETTKRIYRTGTIGKAKEHLEATAKTINAMLKNKIDGNAFTCVSRAIISKASVFIPMFILYGSALFKIMKEQGNHENATQHKYRFFKELYNDQNPITDNEGRFRPDSWEMDSTVQQKVNEIMQKVNENNLNEITDFAGVYREFAIQNGFMVDNVDYNAEVDVEALAKLKP